MKISAPDLAENLVAGHPVVNQYGVVEFGVLGPIRMGRDGEAKVLAGELQRTLLAILLSRANTVVAHSVLTEALWGIPGSRSDANLHVLVHRLRHRIQAPDRLVSEPGGYRLSVLPGELDAERFESLLDQGSALMAVDSGRAAQRLREAQLLCRGEPYDGVDSPVLDVEIQRLRERRMAGMEMLYAAELAAGRHAAVVPDLTEAVAAHPLNERLHALLMIALHDSGRQGQALATYQSARRVIVDEIGQEPGPELRELERRILAGEPVELGADRAAVPNPAQLPGDVRGFTGRRRELESLDQLLEEPISTKVPTSIATIVGTGGGGKTALALRWAHRVREHFADGQLHVDLHGFGPDPPITAGEALGGFLRELGVDSAMIPVGEAERAARFRSLVSGRRLLIVIDNAATSEQVRPLLPGESRCVVVVTSRDSLAGLVARDGARRVLLDRMRPHEALTLLETLVGDRVRAEPTAAVELVERCARLPLAIRIAAELINARPGPRIGDLAAELADQPTALDVLGAGGDGATAIREVFSWSYRRLSPGTARGFRLLGLHPGHDLDLDAAAALLGTDAATTRTTLRTLLRAHHLEESDGRFHMHDLLRAYAIELGLSVDDAAERDRASRRLVDHYVERAEDPPSTAWLDRERSNLAGIARHAARSGPPSAPVRIAAALRGYLKTHAHHDEAIPIYHAALDAATQRGDHLSAATTSRYLGSTYRRIGRFREGSEFMRRALDSYQRAGAQPQAAIQMAGLAVTYTWLGRYDDAVELLVRSRDLGRRLGEAGRGAAVGALIYLGQVHHYRGEPEVTLAYASEALEALVDSERTLRADAAAISGLALERLGRYDEALDQLERSWQMSRADDSPLLIYLSPLASVYWHLDRHDDALEHAHRCLAMTQRSNERTFEPDVRIVLGELRGLAGAHREALDQHRAALSIAEAIELPYQRARAELGIGDALDALGEPAGAATHWGSAQRIWSDFGSRDAHIARARMA